MRDRFDLTGRTAIITGGSRGIGRAIALGFAEAGANIVVASRQVEACEAVAAEIHAAGGRALPVATHVGRPDQLDTLVHSALDEFGGISILVNNAANPLGGMLHEVTELAFEKSYNTNVRAPLLLANRALDALTESGHGSVINVISAGAFAPGPGLGLYCSGKAALFSLTRVMAKEWASRNIRVNALAPGPIDTKMMESTLAVPALAASVVAATALGRVAEPEEVVGAALLLASDAGSYITGAALAVDGGILA